MRGPKRLEDMRADGFLLGELQLAQRAVADVVVRDVSTRVVQESPDAALRNTCGSTLAGVRSPQRVVGSHAELSQVIAS